MSQVLARWNGLDDSGAEEEILPCFGSRTWAQGMGARRPIQDEATLLTVCDEICTRLAEADWDEAFRSHPRIGEKAAPGHSEARSATWSGEEQKKVAAAEENVQVALAEANRSYEEHFDRIFIVCATGKSADEILTILQRRLRNDASTEFREAAEEQRKIAHLRLKKWLAQ